MYMGEKMTTMKMSQATKNRIAKWGKYGDSQEDALNRALDLLEEYELKYGKLEKEKSENPLKALAQIPVLA